MFDRVKQGMKVARKVDSKRSGLPGTQPRGVRWTRQSNTDVAKADLVVPRHLAAALLRLYDYPHPRRPGRLIRGYDKPHAQRTARLCGAVATRMGYTQDTVARYQVACLLHDLGRAGLDPPLFGKIWTWAREQGIPTRPGEWRQAHPETRSGRETEAFLRRYRGALEAQGLTMDAWAREQVEMRLGFARRLRRQLQRVKPRLAALGIQWSPWMERIMLYYYYPERLETAPAWIHRLAEILVACEQLEAMNNRRRGRDYYARSRETLSEAVALLNRLAADGILSRSVIATVQQMAAEGVFDQVLAEARGQRLPTRERRHLRKLSTE